jgi:hypothetical protein
MRPLLGAIDHDKDEEKNNNASNRDDVISEK